MGDTWSYVVLIFSKPIAHHSYFPDQLELQSGHALFGLDYQITMQLLGNKANFRNTRAARQLCSSLTFEVTEYKLMLHMSINAFSVVVMPALTVLRFSETILDSLFPKTFK